MPDKHLLTRLFRR